VFRGSECVFMTAPQQYPDQWNAPLQMGGGLRAAADLVAAFVTEVEVLPGDVVVTGEGVGGGWLGWVWERGGNSGQRL
jgi:hypothetical protein